MADDVLCLSGRTFPSHPYFSTQLGPGQLSLFNLLKAYSLLDEEVGYCQGLSFIAGILLMHVRTKLLVLFYVRVQIPKYNWVCLGKLIEKSQQKVAPNLINFLSCQ